LQAPLPDAFRGKYRGERNDELGEKYAQEVEDILRGIQAKGRGAAAFIAESIPSCAGQITFPPNYLRNVYRYTFPLFFPNYDASFFFFF
jgi:ethanolamine-phosphate phospho-lyase